MKCPYCNKEMEDGFLKSVHHISWGKEKGCGYQEGDIPLTKTKIETFFRGNFVKSCFCNDCKKVIISLEDI